MSLLFCGDPQRFRDDPKVTLLWGRADWEAYGNIRKLTFQDPSVSSVTYSSLDCSCHENEKDVGKCKVKKFFVWSTWCYCMIFDPTEMFVLPSFLLLNVQLLEHVQWETSQARALAAIVSEMSYVDSHCKTRYICVGSFETIFKIDSTKEHKNYYQQCQSRSLSRRTEDL